MALRNELRLGAKVLVGNDTVAPRVDPGAADCMTKYACFGVAHIVRKPGVAFRLTTSGVEQTPQNPFSGPSGVASNQRPKGFLRAFLRQAVRWHVFMEHSVEQPLLVLSNAEAQLLRLQVGADAMAGISRRRFRWCCWGVHSTRTRVQWRLRRLTFELSGPLRWTAGPAWCSITERTTQALMAAVAGPLERGVRPERDWVNSVRC